MAKTKTHIAKALLGEDACRAFGVPLDAVLTEHPADVVGDSRFSGALLTALGDKAFITTKNGESYCSNPVDHTRWEATWDCENNPCNSTNDSVN